MIKFIGVQIETLEGAERERSDECEEKVECNITKAVDLQIHGKFAQASLQTIHNK